MRSFLNALCGGNSNENVLDATSSDVVVESGDDNEVTTHDDAVSEVAISDGDGDVLVAEGEDDSLSAKKTMVMKRQQHRYTLKKPLTEEAFKWYHAPIGGPDGLSPSGHLSMSAIRLWTNYRGGSKAAPRLLEPANFIRMKLADEGELETLKYLDWLAPFARRTLERLFENACRFAKSNGSNPPSDENDIVRNLIDDEDEEARQRACKHYNSEDILYLLTVGGGLPVDEALDLLGFTEDDLLDRLKCQPLTLDELKELVGPDGDGEVEDYVGTIQPSLRKSFVPLSAKLIDPFSNGWKPNDQKRELSDLFVQEPQLRCEVGNYLLIWDEEESRRVPRPFYGAVCYEAPDSRLRISSSDSSDVVTWKEGFPRELQRPSVAGAITMGKRSSSNSLGKARKRAFEEEKRRRGDDFKENNLLDYGMMDCYSFQVSNSILAAAAQKREERQEKRNSYSQKSDAALNEIFSGGRKTGAKHRAVQGNKVIPDDEKARLLGSVAGLFTKRSDRPGRDHTGGGKRHRSGGGKKSDCE